MLQDAKLRQICLSGDLEPCRSGQPSPRCIYDLMENPHSLSILLPLLQTNCMIPVRWSSSRHALSLFEVAAKQQGRASVVSVSRSTHFNGIGRELRMVLRRSHLRAACFDGCPLCLGYYGVAGGSHETSLLRSRPS